MTAEQRQRAGEALRAASRARAERAERAAHTASAPVATVAAARVAVPRPRPITPAAGTAQPSPAPAPARTPVAVPLNRIEPPSPPARRRPLELPVLRIVCWQLALVLVVLAIGRPWPVLTSLLLAATGLLTWTAVRVRGRWLSDELMSRARLLTRRRTRNLPDTGGAKALLSGLAPGAGVGTVELAGIPAGVISRVEELLAVLRPVDTAPAALARFALSGAPLADSGDAGVILPAVRAQLVLHRGPRRGEETRAWLAVRMLREPNFAEDGELLVALGNTVRKLHRKLRGAGMAAAALTEPEVLATLVGLSHTGPGRGAIREERRHWRAGPVAQVGIRVSGLGTRSLSARMDVLHRLLAAVPGVACTVAITVPEHTGVLRLAATTDAAVDAAADRLLRMAVPGVRLDRMDNQHALAVAASLPIGGNP
ncbi:hypothetical protein [Amycolatopsis sp. YIM 10]|uniref:hypothetical protein n=1 Tax=Amycolatopsis sp. YIM 10 TaxID=2653857 RepID=UPI0012A81CC6|nr:hypothetical protein [Amycolatopsis sp. YIM 10]QFU91125.1 hypothetical protein YIM_29795 [Amycolatopsis sp. YIM 10]